MGKAGRVKKWERRKATLVGSFSMCYRMCQCSCLFVVDFHFGRFFQFTRNCILYKTKVFKVFVKCVVEQHNKLIDCRSLTSGVLKIVG